ncbi:rhodanese-like domain-containing protein [Zhouia spongiae]|uniref:Rhodanese-like domain-containing protein n=1 Tax=Zhouia spongiae TaxID=2202721 RepID=A0ABY3YJ96_9FLAO|nr:rhodanese-like domain-containing protein [Zhouia spongiae]UNY97720.1 rhodanese-like domain-containing protein [Zhouia spongiae]
MFFNFFRQRSDNGFLKVLKAADFKAAINIKNVQLIDVRTENEFSSGHIENAVNKNIFNSVLFENYINTLDKDQPVFLYCQSGMRSKKAARKMRSKGFKEVYDLQGGYGNWRG